MICAALYVALNQMSQASSAPVALFLSVVSWQAWCGKPTRLVWISMLPAGRCGDCALACWHAFLKAERSVAATCSTGSSSSRTRAYGALLLRHAVFLACRSGMRFGRFCLPARNRFFRARPRSVSPHTGSSAADIPKRFYGHSKSCWSPLNEWMRPGETLPDWRLCFALQFSQTWPTSTAETSSTMSTSPGATAVAAR